MIDRSILLIAKSPKFLQNKLWDDSPSYATPAAAVAVFSDSQNLTIEEIPRLQLAETVAKSAAAEVTKVKKSVSEVELISRLSA
jgi:hypothetical protein